MSTQINGNSFNTRIGYPISNGQWVAPLPGLSAPAATTPASTADVVSLSPAAQAKTNNQGSVMVKEGDTLSQLLLDRGYSLKEMFAKDAQGKTMLDRVAASNGLKNPNLIFAGKPLDLPSKEESVNSQTETSDFLPVPQSGSEVFSLISRQLSSQPKATAKAATSVAPKKEDTQAGIGFNMELNSKGLDVDFHLGVPELNLEQKADGVMTRVGDFFTNGLRGFGKSIVSVADGDIDGAASELWGQKRWEAYNASNQALAKAWAE